ncbi:transglutaminase [Paenibacillus melissococcoides]|uniref:Transglutaminase n=1 Tax=Paenibacillus melissococcoides TaxID=2912268 RepID=A0ABM9G7V7_9BACL|nr:MULTISPECIES: transglutaminase domain-containing protein [Paenibacillus]MEB9892956.1 transglutaminase domain-containing protein [Bacillus cereus]CAH8248015.1 transglutaminase [Paenibacillus melissococcoides]CAH8718866.1 transglutaminase [Paenibacillus melissococcoides]CAH8719870.1 transglutaminase [Paenibacillus melissococcoides]GIO80670.1 peptidase [Paenibacillus dendritiformis]
MVDADVREGGGYDEGTAIRKRPRRRSPFSVLRMLLLGCFIVSVVAGLALWPTVEARPFEVVLNDAAAMTKWFEERFTQREGISSFRYEGSTDTLTALVTEALSAALHSDPFIRYNVSKYSFQWKGSADYALVTVYVEYRETREQTQFVLNRAREIVQEITAPNDSPHQKVKAIHDYVVSHLTYDEGMTKFTAYEALTEGQTVCQGYALLVHAMLREADIPGQIIEGEAGGTLHAWNLVQLDGSWYHLDATWDDPLPSRGKQIRYTYYLRTDEEMRGDHIWEAGQAPAADRAYALAVDRMKAEGGALSGFARELEKVWSPDVLLADRAVHDAPALAERFQTARAAGSERMQIRYEGDELQLRSDLHDMVAMLGLPAPLEYRVSSLTNSEDRIVEITIPASP